jgi:hypothetical protein
MQKSELLAALKAESQRHYFSTFVDEPPPSWMSTRDGSTTIGKSELFLRTNKGAFGLTFAPFSF